MDLRVLTRRSPIQEESGARDTCPRRSGSLNERVWMLKAGFALGVVLALVASQVAEVQETSGQTSSNAFQVAPSAQLVRPGDRVTVRVELSDPAAQVAAFEFTLAYESDVLTFAQARPGSIEQSVGSLKCLSAVVDEMRATVTIGCFTVGGGAITSGGTIGYITFTADNPGTSRLQLTKTSVADSLAVNICEPCPASNGQVRVSDSEPTTPQEEEPTTDPLPVQTVASPAGVATPTAGGNDELFIDSPAEGGSGSNSSTGNAAASASGGSPSGVAGSDDFPVAGQGPQEGPGSAAWLWLASSVLATAGIVLLGLGRARRRNTL